MCSVAVRMNACVRVPPIRTRDYRGGYQYQVVCRHVPKYP